MDGELLHVILAEPENDMQVDAALRALRRALPRSDGRTLLLFCDLPAADAARLPQDEPLIRRLQSGVMSIARRRPGQALLLVRTRAWDDAARAYLGAGQATPAGRVLSELLAEGRTQTTFAAASFSPGSLKGRFSAVLLTDVSLACTPDTPLRLAHRLTPYGAAHGAVLPHRSFPQTVLERLLCAGFSLSPLDAWREAGFRRAHVAAPLETPALMLTAAALRDAFSPAKPGEAPGLIPCAYAADCAFVQQEPPTTSALFGAVRHRAARGPVWEVLLPVVQLLLLLLSAGLGNAPLALCTLILPEVRAILHPCELPAALMRTALMPAHAAVVVDTLLARGLARSPHLRLTVPETLRGAGGCMFFGAALLGLALASVYALVPLLPVGLLWLAAPLIQAALPSPTIERIPLSPEETGTLRSEAESLFYSMEETPSIPGDQRLLAACCACQLGLLEPDEAGRRAEALLPVLREQLDSAQDIALVQAAALTAAQFLRERMGDCDAALRELPAQIEAFVLSAGPPPAEGLLGRLLCAAFEADAAPLRGAQDSKDGDPLAGLFLPPALLHGAEPDPDTLPLTHPHTYLRRLLLPEPDSRGMPRPAVRFLCLCAAALGHPLEALFLRSPLIAPVAPALAEV